MVSIPAASNSSRNVPDENLETPITLLFKLPSVIARLASFAKLGPIFPPTPKIKISPSRPLRSSIRAGVGSVSLFSNSTNVFMPSPREKYF